MAEFKIADGIDAQVASLSSAGGQISSDSSVDMPAGLSLETCARYIEQQRQIANLLRLYASLVEKDAIDIQKMVDNARRTDQTIAAAM